MNLIDNLEELRMLMMIMTYLSRGRCNQSAMTSSQRNDEVKGYWNPGYDTNSKSSLLFKENEMTTKIDASLAHRRKLCSRNKDQVAQLKSS